MININLTSLYDKLQLKKEEFRAKKGYMGVIGAVAVVVITAVVIVIGAIVLSMVQTAIPYGSLTNSASPGAAEAINASFTSFWSSWGLFPVVIIVIVAGVIVTALLGFAGTSSSQ